MLRMAPFRIVNFVLASANSPSHFLILAGSPISSATSSPLQGLPPSLSATNISFLSCSQEQLIEQIVSRKFIEVSWSIEDMMLTFLASHSFPMSVFFNGVKFTQIWYETWKLSYHLQICISFKSLSRCGRYVEKLKDFGSIHLIPSTYLWSLFGKEDPFEGQG